MMNPGYRKAVSRDADGKILLNLTTASMVSEEPDRRFVDRVEKSLLRALSDNQEQIEALSEVYNELLLIAANVDSLLIEEERREAMEIIASNLENLGTLVENMENFRTIIQGGVAVNGTTLDPVSDERKKYILSVDDTDPDNLSIKITLAQEPTEDQEDNDDLISDLEPEGNDETENPVGEDEE